MASSKKKSSKKPAAKTKKKAAPAKASTQKSTKKAKAAPKKKAAKPAKPAPKSAAKKKPAAKKAAPKAKPAKQPTLADSWGNASMAPKVAAATPQARMSEPSLSPPHALHDHEGGLVSPADEQEELAERIHGGEEAVKDEDEDTGSGRVDDREDEDE